MSTFGLDKITKTMKSKWLYGDIAIVKEVNEVNFKKHNFLYPLCIVVLPDSSMPSIYEGWEDYTYEVYFCMLWKMVNRTTGPMEEKYDAIQFIGNEWLDFVLDEYPNEDLILDPETLEIERIKNFGNDRTLTLKFTFTLQGFRTCFNPKQFYPTTLRSSNISQVYTPLVIHDDGGNKVYEFEGRLTGWWRFDGWKESTLVNTNRYVLKVLGMEKNEDIKAPWVDMENVSYATNPKELKNCCILNSDSVDLLDQDGGDANAHHYGNTTYGRIGCSDKFDPNIPYPEGKGYVTGVNLTTDPQENNKKSIFNGPSWSIGLCFQIGTHPNADDTTWLWHGAMTGQAIPTYPGSVPKVGVTSFQIWLEDGGIHITTKDYTNTDHTCVIPCTSAFGADVYLREDRVVSIVLGYNGYSMLNWHTPWASGNVSLLTPLMSGGGLVASDNFWGMGEYYWMCQGGVITENCIYAFRNRMYEVFTYNYNLLDYISSQTNPVTQLEYMSDYFKTKYGINQ